MGEEALVLIVLLKGIFPLPGTILGTDFSMRHQAILYSSGQAWFHAIGMVITQKRKSGFYAGDASKCGSIVIFDTRAQLWTKPQHRVI